MQNQDCAYVCDQFTEYREESLPSAIRAKVDAHLASCSSCADIYRQLSDTIESLHDLPQVQASSDFTSKLLSRIESIDEQNIWQKLYHSSYTTIASYAVAAGLIVALGINLLIQPISPLQSGPNSNYTGEQKAQIAPSESFAEITDSSKNVGSDSLAIQNIPINPQNQSLQLVSGKK